MTRGLRILLLLALVSTSLPVATQPGPAARDAAARIEFGWFTADARLIEAAAQSLGRERGDPWQSYLRAYAAYRMAALRLAQGQRAGEVLEDCATAAEAAAGEAAAEAEASVLLAACAALAARDEPLRAVLHQRRLRQALLHASTLDTDNPRLKLIAVQYLADEAAGSAPTLEEVLAAFERQPNSAFPDWGQAEAMLLLAERQLALGDRRGARDLIENALLIAPAFSAAARLERQLVPAGPDN
jgi:hypothetical protein